VILQIILSCLIRGLQLWAGPRCRNSKRDWLRGVASIHLYKYKTQTHIQCPLSTGWSIRALPQLLKCGEIAVEDPTAREIGLGSRSSSWFGSSVGRIVWLRVAHGIGSSYHEPRKPVRLPRLDPERVICKRRSL
jgi:hypothetical protein